MNAERPNLTRAEVVRRMGSVERVAEFFNVSRQAVYGWPEDQLIPEGRGWELAARLPEILGDGPFPLAGLADRMAASRPVESRAAE